MILLVSDSAVYSDGSVILIDYFNDFLQDSFSAGCHWWPAFFIHNPG